MPLSLQRSSKRYTKDVKRYTRYFLRKAIRNDCAASAEGKSLQSLQNSATILIDSALNLAIARRWTPKNGAFAPIAERTASRHPCSSAICTHIVEQLG